MTGRDFLLAAQDLMAGASEPHWRLAVVAADYALLFSTKSKPTHRETSTMRPIRGVE